MANVKKNALPNIGDYVDTPRFMTVDISEVFDTYEDMLRAGYTEPTHFRGDFKVNGKSKDEYHMTFACSPNPDYRASTKKSESQPATFSQQVAKQRAKNNKVAKADSIICDLYDDVSEIRQKVKDITDAIYNMDWNQYDMRGYPQMLGECLHATSKVLDSLEAQFDL